MQEILAQSAHPHEEHRPYEPNDEFLQALEKIEKEVNSQDEYVRRQLQAVFEQK